jgi:hypothetical protein
MTISSASSFPAGSTDLKRRGLVMSRPQLGGALAFLIWYLSAGALPFSDESNCKEGDSSGGDDYAANHLKRDHADSLPRRRRLAFKRHAAGDLNYLFGLRRIQIEHRLSAPISDGMDSTDCGIG